MSKLKPEPGIYYNVSPNDYFRLGVVAADGSVIERGSDDYIMSRSALREFARCPQAWKQGRPQRSSAAFTWGTLIDVLCLTPDLAEELLIVQPETYCNAPKEGEFVLVPETYSNPPKPGSFVLTSDFDGDWKPSTKACREWKAEKVAAGLEVLSPDQVAEMSTEKAWNSHAKFCKEWKAEQEAKGLAVLTAGQLAAAREEKPWNNNSDYCKQWFANTPRGREVISSKMNEEAKFALAQIAEDEWFSHILANCQTQTVIVWDWTCPVSGKRVRCKAMIDIVPERSENVGALIDLKTTADASPSAWFHHVKKFGYHYQGAMYLDGWNAAAESIGLDDERTLFAHLISESEAPYPTARRMLDDEFIRAGRSEYFADLIKYSSCRIAGRWPGYSDNAANGFEIVTAPEYLGERANREYVRAEDSAWAAHQKIWEEAASE